MWRGAKGPSVDIFKRILRNYAENGNVSELFNSVPGCFDGALFLSTRSIFNFVVNILFIRNKIICWGVKNTSDFILRTEMAKLLTDRFF